MKYNHRPWSTPVVIASGLVMIISGIMLFFHLGEDFVKWTHEWIGIVMAVGIVLHVHFHWKGFKQYFSKTIGLSIVVVILSISAVLVIQSGNNEPHPAKLLVERYSSKPLQQVAVFENRELEQLVADLKTEKIDITSPEQNLQQIAKNNSMHIFELLTIVLKKQ